MPIFPISEKERKGTLGSYYAVADYKAVNPEFGTMDDFKHLVNTAHEMGFMVILDWVANHTGADNPLSVDHPEWYEKDSLGNMIAPFDWTDVLQLDYDNEEMRAYMTGALKFWVEEANVDGYRCDVASMVPTDFWENARKELDMVKPVFMLAESEKPELLVNAFDMDYAWEFHHIMNEIAKGNKTALDIDNYYAKVDTTYPKGGIRMHFITNHDENSWNGTVFERMGDAVKTFAVMTFTVPGMPLLYSGQETGLSKRLEFFEKDTIIWDEAHEYHAFYTSLYALKKKYPALDWNACYHRIKTSDNAAIYAFVREKGKSKITVVFNLTNEPQEMTVKCKMAEGKYEDLLSGKKVALSQTESLLLGPWDYLILE
jgi:glycosidase